MPFNKHRSGYENDISKFLKHERRLKLEWGMLNYKKIPRYGKNDNNDIGENRLDPTLDTPKL